MNSRPAASEIFAALRLFSHEASHRSEALVMVKPPEQLSPNSPSLKRLPPCMRWSRRLVIRGRSPAMDIFQNGLGALTCQPAGAPAFWAASDGGSAGSQV